MTREETRELRDILGGETPTLVSLAKLVVRLHRQLDVTTRELAKCERERYRLRRIEASTGRIQAKLEAKTAALDFSIKRQEVLRRQLSEALGEGVFPNRASKALAR